MGASKKRRTNERAGERKGGRRNIILFFFFSPTYTSFLFYSSFNGLTTNLEPLKLAVEGQEEGKYRQSEFSGDEWREREREREAHDSRKLQEVKTRTVEKRNPNEHIRITFQLYDVFVLFLSSMQEIVVFLLFISIFPFLSYAFRFFAPLRRLLHRS